MNNRIDQIKMLGVLLLLTLFAMIGCGGGSGGAGSNSFNLFATDDMNPNYSGVWVKIYSADLKNSTGGAVNLFTSSTGLTVNLRALNDGAAKFLLLAPGQVADGSYTKITFELDKTVNLVASPSGAASTATFPNAFDAPTTGHSDLSVDFVPPLTVPGTTKVIIDFDLKNWVVSGGVITPVLDKNDGTGFDDPGRHEKFEFNGAVADLAGTAPLQTFTLTLKNGGTAKVSTDATTQIVADGNVTTLANGQKVEVFGAYDPTANSIVAKIIRSESEFEHNQKAIGLVSNPNLGAETFSMMPAVTRGFAPTGTTITVKTTSTTHFRGGHGVNLTEAQFYAALVLAGPLAVGEAEGTYDAGTNTLTALSVHFETNCDLGDAEANGATVAGANVNAGTFDLTASTSHGFTAPANPLHVVVSTDAEFRDGHEHAMTKADFFTAITTGGQSVEIKGSFANNLFTASRLQLDH